MHRFITRLSLSAIAIAALSFASTSRAQEADEGELKPADLAGAYEIIEGEKFGVPDPADRIKGSTVRFTEDRVVVMDKDSKEVYGATYSLEPSKRAAGEAESGETACEIKLISKLADAEEEIAFGLIDKDGDKVRLIYALPGSEAPKEFKTKAKQLMFVMKKTAR